MNEKKNPIELLAELLAEMTGRAFSAEQELAKLKESDDGWYQHWQRKDAEVKSLTDQLRLKTEALENLEAALQEMEKGAQDHGKSNQ